MNAPLNISPAEQASWFFYFQSCSGGWALTDSMVCPECGAQPDGPCGYDVEAVETVSVDQDCPQQWELF